MDAPRGVFGVNSEQLAGAPSRDPSRISRRRYAPSRTDAHTGRAPAETTLGRASRVMAYAQGHACWDRTWNVFGGCSHASRGCKDCYAQYEAGTRQTRHRVALHEDVTDWVRGKPVFNGKLTVLPSEHPAWSMPLRWKGEKNPVM